jgi:hypothetical protein
VACLLFGGSRKVYCCLWLPVYFVGNKKVHVRLLIAWSISLQAAFARWGEIKRWYQCATSWGSIHSEVTGYFFAFFSFRLVLQLLWQLSSVIKNEVHSWYSKV